jgi:hypothetical protein
MGKWTHKVVKKQRCGGGEWFAYRGTAFASELEARDYALAFAREQHAAGIHSTRIVVTTRGGEFVSEYHTDSLAEVAAS